MHRFHSFRVELAAPCALVLSLFALAGCGDDAGGAVDAGSPVVAGGVCNVEGASAPADDGCNTCSCTGGSWSCTEIACVDAGGGESLTWFTTCGAPVCGGPGTDGPTGETPCTTAQTEGAGCTSAGTLCDPGVGCSTNLICAASDPKLGPGGCPISRARYKQDIEYLSDAQRARLADAILHMPLATFRYRGGDGSEQLGFIIEDVEPSPSVDSPRDRVNLYGYTTMAVAALQQQQRELAALRAELQVLRTELGACAK